MFKAIIEKSTDPADADFALEELLRLPKAGKTSGADHRVSLYKMLGHLEPAAQLSPVLVQSVPPLLAKETHDAVISVLVNAFTPHLAFSLRENLALSSETSTTIAKGMGDAKPAIRRAFCSLVANALWQLQSLSTDAALSFAKGILPSFEMSLKAVTASPTSTPAGPLEGYIAVAMLLGPVRRSDKFGEWERSSLRGNINLFDCVAEEVLSRNADLRGLLVTGTKPSFLLWDKVYQKLTDAEDEKWLVRASEEVLDYYKDDLEKSEAAR